MIYLDNAATSYPKAPTVAEAVRLQVIEGGGNPGRASHSMARDASELLFDVREETARFLGISCAERLVFTKNATEALNLAILGSVRAGATVAVSSLEHNAVMRPLRWLEASRGIRVLTFGCDQEGRPDPAELDAVLAARPDLFIVTMASNVTGALLPVEEIAERCRAAGIPIGVDASQVAGHRPISADDMGVSFLCFPGHKGLLGPTGTGGLYAAPGFDPEPLIRGGTGSVSESETQPNFLPDRYEAGTANVLGLAGLLAAVRFLSRTGMDTVRARESAATERLLRGLAGLPGLKAYGPPAGADRTPIVTVTAQGLSSADIARELDLRDIAVRAGLHCAPAAHRSIGTFAEGGAVRFSPGYFTTDADVDATISAMEDILRL